MRSLDGNATHLERHQGAGELGLLRAEHLDTVDCFQALVESGDSKKNGFWRGFVDAVVARYLED